LTGNTAAIVIVSGTITGNEAVKVGANKSVLGASGASLVGVGLRVIEVNNVIIRNLKISKVLADAGDAIGVQAANNVWIDHVTVSSDRDHDKDYYDGLIDITHGCQYVTVSWSVLRDHWKASLVGHSDSNGSEDVNIKVTYALNYWTNLNSRLPSFRFGYGHIFNNYYENSNDGINTRDGAQLLIENNVFSGVSKAVYATDAGYAVLKGNDLGGGTNTAGTGTFTTAPYSYSLVATTSVKSTVLAGAGATLSF
jgi:pectate lyase